MRAVQFGIGVLLLTLGVVSIVARKELVALARRRGAAGAMLSRAAWLAFGAVSVLAGALQIVLAVA